MTPNKVSRQEACRFLVRQQGLAGNPVWAGRPGAQAAVEHTGYVQMDSISVVARSHDLTLWSRVDGYRPEDLQSLLWQERTVMEGQMPLAIVPAADAPYSFARFRKRREGIERELKRYKKVVQEVLERVEREGALSSRDFQDRKRVPGGFNTQKDALKALELLWYAGRLVTSHRTPDFTRYFDLPERIFPGVQPAPEGEAALFWARKSLHALGMATVTQWAARLRMWWRSDATAIRALIQQVIKSGEAIPVQVDELKSPYYVPRALLAELMESGEQSDRLTFLAPLDNLIWDRGRLLELFGFDYRWEVYTPAAKRRWGYYTLPILYGSRLVGRFDPKIDRKAAVLYIQGFWLEEAPELAADAVFSAALSHRLGDFARFHGAGQIAPPPGAPPWLVRAIENSSL